MKIEKTEELQGFVIKNMLKVSYEIQKNLQKIIKKLWKNAFHHLCMVAFQTIGTFKKRYRL